MNGKKVGRRDGVFSETSRGYGCEFDETRGREGRELNAPSVVDSSAVYELELELKSYICLIDNDSADFERPEHYIRHIGSFPSLLFPSLPSSDLPSFFLQNTEPIESELKNQVEYDMDEQGELNLPIRSGEEKREGRRRFGRCC